VTNFHDLFNDIVHGKDCIDDLNDHDEVIRPRDQGQKFDCVEAAAGDHATAGRKLKSHCHHTEQIEVGIINSEVQENCPGVGLGPEVFLELSNNIFSVIALQMKVLHIAISTVSPKLNRSKVCNPSNFDYELKILKFSSKLQQITKYLSPNS